MNLQNELKKQDKKFQPKQSPKTVYVQPQRQPDGRIIYVQPRKQAN